MIPIDDQLQATYDKMTNKGAKYHTHHHDESFTVDEKIVDDSIYL